ncbi:MAG: hypothetical protein AAF934_12765 [Bacteroidota bacterium]
MKIFKELIEVFSAPEARGVGGTAVETKTLGSVFIALSGILLFSDKILEALGIEGSNTFGFTNFSNFVWVFTQSIAPVVMIVGFLLKPYILSLLIPIYCYTIQVVWIFDPNMSYNNPSLHIYATGSCIIFLILAVFINKYSIYKNKKDIEDKRFIEETNKTIELLKQEILKDKE